MQENPDMLGVSLPPLNPDELAETMWRLYSERTEAEAVVNAGGLTARGVVDRTGSPNRAGKPSLNVT